MDDSFPDTARAHETARKLLEDAYAQMHVYNDVDYYYQESDFDQRIEDENRAFVWRINQAYHAIAVLIEVLGLARNLDLFITGFKKFTKNLTQLEHYDHDHDLVSNPAIDYLNAQLRVYSALFDVTELQEGKRDVLRLILNQASTLFDPPHTSPSREFDVHDALEPVLKLAFPDVIRNPPVPQPTKTYKPDFGIESIATAVEVKFAKSKTEAKKMLGELYEDMKGYSGTRDFSMFYGLFYITGPFTTQEVVDAEIKRVGVPKNWNILVVTGPGKVVQTKKKVAAKSKSGSSTKKKPKMSK